MFAYVGRLIRSLKRCPRSSVWVGVPRFSFSGLVAACVGIGCGAGGASVSRADIVLINIAAFGIAGTNAGLASGTGTLVNNFPFAGAGVLGLSNREPYGESGDRWTGMYTQAGSLGILAGTGEATPSRLGAGGTIGPSFESEFQTSPSYTLFRHDNSVVAGTWALGSYLGFRTSDVSGGRRYGWLEVTWNPSAGGSPTGDFRVLAGAYESTPNTAILAGAVPEPPVLALAGIACAGVGWIAASRLRQRRKANRGRKSSSV